MAVLINDPTLAAIWGLIEQELARGRALHPNFLGILDPVRSCALVAEEAGEAIAEALDATRPGIELKDAYGHLDKLGAELIQTAAMAIAVLVTMRELPAAKE